VGNARKRATAKQSPHASYG